MARRRGWRRRRNRRLSVAGVVLLAVVVISWSRIWPFVLAAVGLAGVGALVWWGWRTHREIRRKDAAFRAEQRVLDANRSLEKVDKLHWRDFERMVAAMLREGGCTEVEWVGRGGDRGRDVTGVLPDGRSMVVQCKLFATHRSVVSGDMQRLLGARTNFAADVAIFVTNTRFTADAERYAQDNDIIAIGRNLFASWLKGSRLEHVLQTGVGGQGDRKHLKTWKRTYAKPRSRRRKKPAS
ncbi:restriction endonuclease [Streptomyces sp. 8K308]|uniref:restriction endonuclease n=1 Tax=Streptomyces sp. 8K308 TaxID=2530388 RepID=UPI00140551DC|nr:restriction endonuclease [Streptomyces sp. 8K308]